MALGRSLVIARYTAPDTYAAICVTEARSLTINNEVVDITKPDCTTPGGKLAYAAQYGIQKFSFSGAGAYVNATAQKAVIADAVAQTVTEYQITVPDVGVFVGDGLLTTTNLAGDKTNEMQADFAIELTGTITFTPAA
ncbi:phage tail tube protein [Hoeflea sp.]|uniref:phage tail tube protein n=1 Tax=Hoeflea sp. TaxID=1940281 RepID=UPI0019A8803A|nr:phage tail tube protein [Hoeflea sp.]MBC7280036.1 phage tail protein [Hoeflea sp.]